MVTSKMFFRLTGIALAAAFILSGCNAVATVAPAPASALPVLPSATATSAPTVTEPPLATVAPTATDTATAVPTATLPPVAQVIPSVTAYCRSGPGSNYNQITTVTAGRLTT